MRCQHGVTVCSLLDTHTPLRRLRNLTRQRITGDLARGQTPVLSGNCYRSPYLRLEDIDFRGRTTDISAIRVHGTGVRFPWASATRKLLTREIRQLEVIVLGTRVSSCDGKTLRCRLVGSRSDVARVVRVRPLIQQYREPRSGVVTAEETHHALQTSTISSTTKVTHRPDGRPKSKDVVGAREHNRRKNHTASEAELVPCRHHATLEVEVVNLLATEGDLKGPVLGSDC